MPHWQQFNKTFLKDPKDSFFIQRLKGIRYALRGVWLLIKSEASIQVQLGFAILGIAMGFYFEISAAEWLAQLLVIGMVLVAEALNTGIEKLSDFVHPEYHEKIGFIKDVSAGAAAIAALISLAVAAIIYIPKISLLF
jgi:diacylglycerol kinase (ATP)